MGDRMRSGDFRHRPATAGRRLGALAVVVGGLTLGCQAPGSAPNRTTGDTTGDATGATPKGHKMTPPTEAYVPVTSWASRFAPDKQVPAPKAESETWRAYVHQFSPMQKQTPQWLPLPATENVHLSMPAGSAFACMVTPLKVEPMAEMDLEAWVLSRELRCSSDGYRTWTAYPHYVRVSPDGDRTGQTTRAALRERLPDGTGLRQTVVQLRDDAQPRRATMGPPQIIEHKNHP